MPCGRVMTKATPCGTAFVIELNTNSGRSTEAPSNEFVYHIHEPGGQKSFRPPGC